MSPPFKIAVGSESATSKVLTNVDLMDDIVLRLPTRQILSLNGVCKGWEKVYNESSRIQKVLFLSPATEHKIYYPNCNKPIWYLAPSRGELLTAGFVPMDSDEDIINPDNYLRRTPAVQKKEVKFTELANNIDGKLVTISNGKFRNPINFTPAGRCKPADGSSSVMATEGSGPSGENTGSDEILFKGRDSGNTGTQVKGNIESISDMNAFGQKGKDKAQFATNTVRSGGRGGRKRTKIPRRIDDKMMVRRVVPPFINPFFELFFDNFYRGIRGVYYAKNAVPPYRIPDISYPGELVLRPKMRHGDGTTETIFSNGKPARHSSKTNAVMSYDASWRKMHPFSATTSSIEVECFDFGNLEIFCDWGLLCGNMMEQLGNHWSEQCQECCIPEFWFSEFIKLACRPDGSHANNRGDHGVRKLGSVDQTGWEILALLNAAPVKPGYFLDRIRPY
jgi:hypothetical protein